MWPAKYLVTGNDEIGGTTHDDNNGIRFPTGEHAEVDDEGEAGRDDGPAGAAQGQVAPAHPTGGAATGCPGVVAPQSGTPRRPSHLVCYVPLGVCSTVYVTVEAWLCL